jgi:hypothetical protein
MCLSYSAGMKALRNHRQGNYQEPLAIREAIVGSRFFLRKLVGCDRPECRCKSICKLGARATQMCRSFCCSGITVTVLILLSGPNGI